MNLKSMSEKELEERIAKKYGKEWTPADVDPDDELVKEFFRRAEEAID